MIKSYVAVILIWVTTNSVIACTYIDTETSTGPQTTQTLNLIQTKEEDVKRELDKYKEALKEKKKRMTEMLRTLMGIEALMMKNQVTRKEILKYWENVSQTHTLQN